MARMRRAQVLAALSLLATLAACGGAAKAGVTPHANSPATAAPPAAGQPSSLGATPARRAATLATPSFHLKVIAAGLTRPLSVTSPPGDKQRQFIVEQRGKILVRSGGTLLAKPFLNVSGLLSGGNEQGLLGLAFDPRYATNGRFYIDYTDHLNHVVIARYTVSRANPNAANAASGHILLSIAHPYTNHNGGQLAFGPDGRLYIGVGDGGSEGDPHDYGQNLHVLLAKILRLNVNATHPTPQMYAYGLRNPWPSRSTVPTATSGSATSARTPGRRSTSSRPARHPAPTSAGATMRATTFTRSSRSTGRALRFPCSSTRIRRAAPSLAVSCIGDPPSPPCAAGCVQRSLLGPDLADARAPGPGAPGHRQRASDQRDLVWRGREWRALPQLPERPSLQAGALNASPPVVCAAGPAALRTTMCQVQ